MAAGQILQKLNGVQWLLHLAAVFIIDIFYMAGWVLPYAGSIFISMLLTRGNAIRK